MASLKFKEIFCLFYSTLLFISGIVLIVFSVISCYKLFYHFKFVPTGTIGPFVSIFLLGFIHLLLTWLAIKGPTREHDFHIILFMVCSLILLLIELAIGTWSMILWGEVEVQAITLLIDSFNEMIKVSYNKKEWVRLQSQLKCCGLNGSIDYSERHDSFPTACTNLEKSNGTFQILYEEGCKYPLVKYVKSVLIDGALMGFMPSLFHAFGIFLYWNFLKSLKEERANRIAKRLAMQREATQNQANSPSTESQPPTST